MKKQNNYYVEEREIDVKRMLIHALTYWRVILVVAVLGAVILGVKQYRSDVTNAKNNIQAQIDAANTPVATIESLEERLSPDTIRNVWNAVNYKTFADERTTYMNESVYMNLDAYNENVIYLTYNVYSSKAASIIDMYTDYLMSEQMAEKVCEKMQTIVQSKYIMELYTLSSSDGTSNFKVQVCAASEEECESLADTIDHILLDYQEFVKKIDADVQVEKETRIADIIIDSELLSLRTSYNTEIYNNMSMYNGLLNSFNDTQKALFNLLMEKRQNSVASLYGDQETEETVLSGDASAIDTTIHVRPSIKMILTGFLAGTVIAYAACALRYTVSKSVHGMDEVKYLFGIPVYGNIRVADYRKKRIGACLDTAIDKLNGERGKYLDSDKQMQMVYSNLLLNCKNNDIKEIYLTGSKLELVPEKCITELVNQLKGQQIQVTVGNSILYDAESLLKMAEIGHVVFVEMEEKSDCESIAKELNLCVQNHIQVMGMILARK